MKRKDIKKQNIIEFALVFAIIVIIWTISSFVSTRVDLTSEKRYTLAKTTKDYLKGLENIVYVKVYLESDHLPAGLNKLQRSVKELLDEFRVHSKEMIEYSFINPTESPDQTTTNEIVKQLMEYGIEPFDLNEKDDEGGQSVRRVFPGALLTYRAHGQEYQQVVNFYKEKLGYSVEQTLNLSIESLEYEFITAIRKISKEAVDKIAFIEGNGELGEMYVDNITRALEEFYLVDRIAIDGQLNSLRPYKAIIIANPVEVYNDFDKYIIDQYIMKGGRVLWLVDAVDADMDDLAAVNSAMAKRKISGLSDMLYSYGVRINGDLILDQRSTYVPLNVSTDSLENEWKAFPWAYIPIIETDQNNPITKNISDIRLIFASTMDTVQQNPNIKKTVLLRTSELTRNMRLPNPISIEKAIERFGKDRSNKPFSPVSILMEGIFTSHFKNRLTEAFLNNDSVNIENYEESEITKMIIVSDGNVIENGTRTEGGRIQILPLGFDKYTRAIYGNKNFLLNCVNYLCDDSGLINVRSRELQIRRLDFDKVTNDKVKWQLINLIVPLGLVALFGFFVFYFRKKRYAN
ncbi:gliding motility-associated ABC transporter substrate-binding protein GldG [Bacteroidota bacterium]